MEAEDKYTSIIAKCISDLMQVEAPVWDYRAVLCSCIDECRVALAASEGDS